jgi:23S rRNA-/tRNA-specific pseudouridylate synthase
VSRLGPVGGNRVGSVGTGGVAAETGFALVEALARGLLIEAQPRTGRKHQVRVHLAEAGLPVLGDELYGGNRLAPRLMLHAQSLGFRHPLTGVGLLIDCPYPDDFRRMLQTLRAAPAIRARWESGGPGRTRVR